MPPRQKIAHCRALLSAPQPQAPVQETAAEELLRLTGADIHRCPACHEGRMVVVAEIDRAHWRSWHLIRVEIHDSS